jgi:hypothetical protein
VIKLADSPCWSSASGSERILCSGLTNPPEVDAPEPNAKVVRMSEAPAPARASVVQMRQMSGTPVAEDEIVPEPWRAPVARMY